MPISSFLCRLCINSCNEFKSLLNDDGQLNGVYEIAVKYFDAMLLNPRIQYTSMVICKECWQCINDFHTYQQSVINSQSQLEYVRPIVMIEKLNNSNMDKFTSCNNRQQATSLSVNDLIHINDNPIPVDKQTDSASLQSDTNSTAVSVFDIIQINNKPEYPDSFGSEMRARMESDAFIAKWKGDLECVLCKSTFSTYTLLNKHFRNRHSGKECYVVCCGRKLNKRCRVLKHIRHMHTGVIRNTNRCRLRNISLSKDCLRRPVLQRPKKNDARKYKCELCTAAYMQERNLRQHCRLKHKDYPMPQYVCNHCNMIFNTHSRLEKHMNQDHSDMNQYKNKEHCNYNELGKYKGNEKPTCDKSDAISITAEKHLPTDQSGIIACGLNINNNEDISLHLEKDLKTEQSEFQAKDKLDDFFLLKLSSSKASIMQYDAFIKKWKGDLECPKCKVMLETYSLLIKHFQTEHPKERPYTKCCNLKHTSRCTISAHLRLHIDPNAYQCNICEKRFKTSWNLESHKRHVHDNEPRSSSNVGHSKKRRIIADDAFIAKSMGDLECVLCKKTFSTYTLLSLHFKVKHRGQQCRIVCCGRKIIMRWRLVRHIREIHNVIDTKSYKCKTCNSSFSKGCQLRTHIRKMHDENPQSSNVSATDNVESQEKSTESNSSVPVPYNEIHIPPLDIVDIKDEIAFTSDMDSDTEQLEFITLDPNEKSKDMTDESFLKDLNLVESKNMHYDAFIKKWKGNLECDKCKVSFANFTLLVKHFRTQHPLERAYVMCCNLKHISRNHICAHLRLHVDPNAYQCNICEKRFKTFWNLKSHKRHVHDGESYCRCFRQSKILVAKMKKTGKSQLKRIEYLNQNYDTTVCCNRKQRLLKNDSTIAQIKAQLECWVCKASFAYYSLLRDHFQYEHPNEKFYIDCCKQNLCNVSDVLRHIRRDHVRLTLNCELCYLTFTHIHYLRMHMRNIHDVGEENDL